MHALVLALLAQTAAVAHDDVSRGVTLPPTSTATVDDATAIAVNPAGLAYAGATQLFYAHERSFARNAIGDGLYFSDSLLGALGVGVSIEWLRMPGLDYRKTAYAIAAG